MTTKKVSMTIAHKLIGFEIKPDGKNALKVGDVWMVDSQNVEFYRQNGLVLTSEYEEKKKTEAQAKIAKVAKPAKVAKDKVE